MNIAILRGNVGQEPKITEFKDGGKVAQFSLATTERGYETSDGRKVEEKTTWHNIVVKRGGLAKIAEQYIKKGTPLLVVGKIETRSYEDGDGKTRYVTEVVATDFELLGAKAEHEMAPAPQPEDFKGANRQEIASTHKVETPQDEADLGTDLPF